MAERPMVSVIMPVLRPDPVFLRQAVQSVLAQTCAAWEMVVVEDPSPQSAKDLLREFDDPRIKYAGNAERTSLVDQLNQALNLARADLVARLDADDLCEPERLAKQADFLHRHAEVAVLGSQLTVIDPTGRVRGWRRYPLDHAAILRAMPRYNPIAHPSVMMRKAVILAAGAYTYRDWPAEDYELWCRLAQQGTRLANHPEPLVRYRIHPGAAKSKKLRAILRGTLDVKQRYWRGRMDLAAHLRMGLERVLLRLPSPLVLRLFAWTQYRRRPPLPPRET